MASAGEDVVTRMLPEDDNDSYDGYVDQGVSVMVVFLTLSTSFLHHWIFVSVSVMFSV